METVCEPTRGSCSTSHNSKTKEISWTDKNQLADTWTKGNFTRDEWNHLLCLFNISHFSSINSLEAMSKRTQEDAGEERVTLKIKADDEFGLTIQRDGSERACLDCIGKPRKTKSESRNVPLSSLNEQQTRTGLSRVEIW